MAKPFGSSDPPAALFHYSRDRGGKHPRGHLAEWSGILQADAYAGFNALYVKGRVPAPLTEASCWAHGGAKFFELANLAKAMRAPMAIEAVRRIDEIFAIERELNGEPAERRRIVRQARVRPLVEGLERWMRAERSKLSSGSAVAKAMDYMVKRWTTFSAFLDDGRICLTNNAAERALRGIAVGRRNWTFAGSDDGASYCSSRHVVDRSRKFCWRSSGDGHRERRRSAWRRISSRSMSACRMIQGAPLQCCSAGSVPSAMRRRMVD